MNRAIDCPGRAVLEQLQDGKVPFPEVESLARHLEECESCIRIFQSLTRKDTLSEMLRGPGTAPFKESDTLTSLMARLRRLRSPGPATAAGAGTRDPASAAVIESYDFLAPPQAADEIGRLGPYRVLRVLGAGGMGMVFQAEDPHLRRNVALKVVKPVLAASASAGKRFLREARTTASIKHDHIVTIYQVGEDRGVAFLAMEFLTGASLEERLHDGNKLSMGEILRIGREIAEGLAAAHARGLVHRDIKPANIWLEAPAGRVKILDFGLARVADDNTNLTQEGAIVGTPAYMAPEQASGGTVDERSDLFSLGCVLYRLCTGRAPFQGATTMEILAALCMETPRPARELNPAVPPALSNLVQELIDKERQARPESAQAVIERLRAIEQGSATVPVAPSPRRWLWITLGGVAVALLLVALLWQVIGGRKSPLHVSSPDDTIGQGGAPTDMPEDAWLAHVHGLPAKEQAAAVIQRLQALNPGFDGTHTSSTDDTSVTYLQFCSDNVADVRPVRALTGLHSLGCDGSGTGKGKLADLTPLKGMALTRLSIEHNPVADLTPLQDMRLHALRIRDTGVVDLSALKLLPLREVCGDFDTDAGRALLRWFWALESINDRSALDYWMKHDDVHGRYLQWMEDTRQLPTPRRLEAVASMFKKRNPLFPGDLKPVLRNGTVVEVGFNTDQVEDVSPLRALPWAPRNCIVRCNGGWKWKGKLADLSPLQQLPIGRLECREHGGLRDVTALRHMPLTYLDCGQTNIADLSPLRGLKLQYLACYFSRVRDLEPLRGMPLKELHISGCRVPTLAPLHDMPLETLEMKQVAIKDLTPLEGTPLRRLDCDQTNPAPDLASLRKTPIRELSCEHPERQAGALARVWTLETINSSPAAPWFDKHHPDHAHFLHWIQATSKLPAAMQSAEVKAKLKDRNRDLNVAQIEIRIGDTGAASVSLPGESVTDLAPLRGLADLRSLDCSGRNALGTVSDLSPLMGLNLAFLNCARTEVKGLTPVRGMPLQELTCDPALAQDHRRLLQSIRTLQTVNQKTSAEFWKGFTPQSGARSH
jgi:serine/threonine protein kinase/Leucine-rich repeat (LRR) protein